MQLPDQLSDQVLVERSLQGNLSAFETLVQRYQAHVHRFLYHFMRHAQDAEDFTQETFVNFYRKLDRYKPGYSLKSWLLTMARNLAISHLRKKSAAPVDPTIMANLVREVASGPEKEIILQERVQDVQEALGRLDPDMREILIMRYMMDISLQEVAQALEIPEGTAKSRVFKARKLLRESLRCVSAAEDRSLQT